ncbi:LOW QUALITY PROTEIN: hypothetical protein OSB04_003481 [Centaurea solstitialis]|uniref:Uncharacterized protein n=1 Tax=Centaurea solstitialis TaxID=347529 RepID=A0AA38WTS3_9ASTR|nr:LOW QUALITY PROTEIN: hypothetical protein OSB04_003481 [Centaurea solstitialis]
MWKTGEENGCGKRVRKTDVENGCGKRVRKTDVENGCGKRVWKTGAENGCGKRVFRLGKRIFQLGKRVRKTVFSDSENGCGKRVSRFGKRIFQLGKRMRKTVFSDSENGRGKRVRERSRKTGFPIRKTDFPTRKIRKSDSDLKNPNSGLMKTVRSDPHLCHEYKQLISIPTQTNPRILDSLSDLTLPNRRSSAAKEQLKSYARKIPDVSRNGLVTDVGEELKKLICSLAYIKCSSKTKQAKNRHSNEQGHWPAKSAKFIRDLLKNAESNTEVMSQDEDSGLQPTQSSTPSEFLPTSSTSKLPQNLVSSTPNPSLKSVSKRHTGVPSSSMAPTLEPISPSLEHSPMEFSQKDSPRVSPNSQKVPSKEQDGMWMAQPTALVQGAGQDRLNINKTFSTETQDEQSSRGPRCQETMGVAGASSRQRTSTNSSKDPSRVGNTPEHGEDSYTYD